MNTLEQDVASLLQAGLTPGDIKRKLEVPMIDVVNAVRRVGDREVKAILENALSQGKSVQDIAREHKIDPDRVRYLMGEIDEHEYYYRTSPAYKAFAAGFKPAILIRKKSRSAKVLHKRGYPLATETGGRSDSDIMFFQDIASRDDFIEKINARSDYRRRILGLALGYAPQAVDEFVDDDLHEKTSPEDYCEIRYFGISFGCRKAIADECIAWMKEHRPIPEGFQGFIYVIGREPHKLIKKEPSPWNTKKTT